MTDTLVETMTTDSPAFTVPIATDLVGSDVTLELLTIESLLISFPRWMKIETTVIHTVLDHIIAKNKPNILRLILVDLCDAGLKSYDGTEQLLTPVIDQVERYMSAHQWINKEIQKRLDLFANNRVKTIEEYNESSGFSAMEYIVVVDVDLSEAMMVAPSWIYDNMDRIMLNARRTGFIMIATTKRPRDKMSRLYRNRIAYNGSDEVGIVNYLPYGSGMSKKIRLTCKV